MRLRVGDETRCVKEAGMICEECGSEGEGGELEYADGTCKHWRNKAAWADGKAHPIMCAGKFVTISRVPKGGGK